MNRIGKGVGSLILLAVLLVGIPAGLVLFAGNPLPSWDELVAGFTMRDYTGSFLVGTIMPIAAWIAWATFAVGFLAELPAQLRGVPRPRIPGSMSSRRSWAVCSPRSSLCSRPLPRSRLRFPCSPRYP